ncbi:DNA mismatch repair protein Msh6-like isoform X2 [Convolutriloba macropyga]|uniref:DNA mismatch repair protein Msh6-like isoform X2 n=1 Tax=Convolutriloba macropyga TaxID=536237 RepID=UPI003F51F7C6
MQKRQQQSLTNFFSPLGSAKKSKAESSSASTPRNKSLSSPFITGIDKKGNYISQQLTPGNGTKLKVQSSQPLGEDVNINNSVSEDAENNSSDVINTDLSDKQGMAEFEKKDARNDSPVKCAPASSKKYKRLRIYDSDEEESFEPNTATTATTATETNDLNLNESFSAQQSFKGLSTPVAKSRKIQINCDGQSPTDLLSPFNFNSQETPRSDSKKFNDSFNSVPKTPKLLSKTEKRPPAVREEQSDDEENFKHLSFKFLQFSQIKDKKMRPVDHPDYDPTTLHVPKDFLHEQTPGHQQWWLFKVDHYDTVLFFKVGKFYELYHMDAVIAVEELGLTFMRDSYAHSGFPEIGFDKFSDILVQKGYKIARVEQTETPDEMQARVSKMSKSGKKVMKYDRVVAREVCQITTKATQLPSSANSQSSCQTSGSNYLSAIVEKPLEFNVSSYGLCYVDTKVGTVHFCQFSDDRFSSVLRVFFSHLCPAEILHIKGSLTQKSLQVIKSLLPSVKLTALKNESQFYSGLKVFKVIQEGGYFEDENRWPQVLKDASNDELQLCQKLKQELELAINAFGGVLFMLKECMIDFDVITLGDFEVVVPPIAKENLVLNSSMASNACAVVARNFEPGAKMILDSSTIANLGIVDNFGKSSFTLLNALDTCATPFGKRMLKQVICTPPCYPDAIIERQDAVVWLMENREEFCEKVKFILQKVPDLEHLLCRIHSLSVDRKATDHPDSRANFFEVTVYKKRNVQDFVLALKTLKKCMEVARLFEGFESDSVLLNELMKSKSDGGKFPIDIEEFVENFEIAFDQTEACQTGEIQPKPGLAKDYDAALQELSEIKAESEKYLREQRKFFRCDRIQYANAKNSQFQLEIPSEEVSRVPDDYQFASKRKGWDRFQTSVTRKFVQRWTNAESNRDELLKNLTRIVFSDFSKEFAKCSRVVRSIGMLDVLIALADFSRTADPIMCRPQIVDSWSTSLDIQNGKHPCIENAMKGSYIPNNTQLGKYMEDPESQSCDSQNTRSSLILLTGPNMGGKSTLMRQTGLLIVLAQIGCFVPAERMSLTPVDRIFTRLGAMDRILCGESTFFVEMSETCCVLNYATRHSLVLLDELGRGTSTFDGTAIASAVAKKLADEVGCRTLFSTHYHLLVSDFRANPRVFLGHMACMEEDDEDCEEDDIEDGISEQKVTFLYKFVQGNCPKSYGFNAARMAGIDKSNTKAAQRYSNELETRFLRRQKFMQFAKLFAQ